MYFILHISLNHTFIIFVHNRGFSILDILYFSRCTQCTYTIIYVLFYKVPCTYIYIVPGISCILYGILYKLPRISFLLKWYPVYTTWDGISCILCRVCILCKLPTISCILFGIQYYTTWHILFSMWYPVYTTWEWDILYSSGYPEFTTWDILYSPGISSIYYLEYPLFSRGIQYILPWISCILQGYPVYTT